MTFQFKSRTRETLHEECEKEMALLRDYNKALEKENESRNEERKALQEEIERLQRHEREWKERGAVGKSTVVVASESREYVQLKEQYA
jgi:single-stranded DNA-specific DHH superfamily exonuclease